MREVTYGLGGMFDRKRVSELPKGAGYGEPCDEYVRDEDDDVLEQKIDFRPEIMDEPAEDRGRIVYEDDRDSLGTTV